MTATANVTATGSAEPKTSTASVPATATEINAPPLHDALPISVAEDGSVTFDPRSNDSTGPANESSQTLTVTAVTQGAHGTVSFTGGSEIERAHVCTPVT